MIPPLLIHRFSHDATAAGEAVTGENLQLLTHARGGTREPRRAGGGICQIGIIQMKKEKRKRKGKELMIIPSIGSQLPNNFSRPTYVRSLTHSFAESFSLGQRGRCISVGSPNICAKV